MQLYSLPKWLYNHLYSSIEFGVFLIIENTWTLVIETTDYTWVQYKSTLRVSN